MSGEESDLTAGVPEDNGIVTVEAALARVVAEGGHRFGRVRVIDKKRFGACRELLRFDGRWSWNAVALAHKGVVGFDVVIARVAQGSRTKMFTDAAHKSRDRFANRRSGIVRAHADHARFQSMQPTSGDESRLSPARGPRVHNDGWRYSLREELADRTHESQRAERRGCAERDGIRSLALTRQSRDGGVQRRDSLLATADMNDLGAEQSVEKRVGARRIRWCTIGDEHRVQAELGGDCCGGARVVGLHAADRDERISAGGQRFGGDERELPDFVASETKRNRVVPLGQDTRGCSQRFTEALKFLDGSGRAQEWNRAGGLDASERGGVGKQSPSGLV